MAAAEREPATCTVLSGRLTRRHIRMMLGSLWLLDGLLQFQPFMFTSGFANQILAPAGEGQPGFVSGPVHWAAQLIAAHPAVWDVVFAVVQVGIGIGMFATRTVRAALALSIGWAIGVWYFGEGLGGLAGGRTSMLAGAPGAVVVYAALALVVWPRETRHIVSREGPRNVGLAGGIGDSAVLVGLMWAALWVGGAILSVLPSQRGSRQVAATIAGAAAGAPVWLAHLDRRVAAIVIPLGPGLIVGLVALQLIIATMPLARGPYRRAILVLSIAVLTAEWVLGQSFGQLYSGQATDPNAAVPIMLLALATLVPTRSPEIAVARLPYGELIVRADLATTARPL